MHHKPYLGHRAFAQWVSRERIDRRAAESAAATRLIDPPALPADLVEKHALINKLRPVQKNSDGSRTTAAIEG
jgi:hypothetical protein